MPKDFLFLKEYLKKKKQLIGTKKGQNRWGGGEAPVLAQPAHVRSNKEKAWHTVIRCAQLMRHPSWPRIAWSAAACAWLRAAMRALAAIVFSSAGMETGVAPS
eukprot:2978013-Amphidinium_carterae.1